MRKVVYSLTNSLDNFIARVDGGYDWILMDDEVMSEFPRTYASFDTILMGRKTYDIALRQPAETDIFMGLKTYVFSRAIKDGSNAGVKIVSGDGGEFVRNLKNESGKDIWLMGGGILAASLLRERLVDEIRLAIQPVLLGSGIPLFPGTGLQLDLQLLECKTYKSGIARLTYRVKY
ncbi:MAG: dihydrofolate reductase [Chloracidobacterium sp.]|nr:dihydrofolate reductase [Chloracidobacterium sp.]